MFRLSSHARFDPFLKTNIYEVARAWPGRNRLKRETDPKRMRLAPASHQDRLGNGGPPKISAAYEDRAGSRNPERSNWMSPPEKLGSAVDGVTALLHDQTQDGEMVAKISVTLI